jgi:hypothetical protein
MMKVVRIRQGWSYRIVYDVGDRWIRVHMIVPSWFLPGKA